MLKILVKAAEGAGTDATCTNRQAWDRVVEKSLAPPTPHALTRVPLGRHTQ